MKIVYNSFPEVAHFAHGALKGLFSGLFRSLWAVFLLIANAAVLALRKVSEGIRRKPVAAVVVLLFILAASNLAVYASMKAKLSTAEWEYDRLRMHMDSVYEVYNIHNSYSRIVSYEK